MASHNCPQFHTFSRQRRNRKVSRPGCAHWINLLFMTLLMRSGLQILMDHPRLYWNVHCTPATEWVRFTPVKVPMDRLWTAKDDARYLSPWIGLPGGRHTIGL